MKKDGLAKEVDRVKWKVRREEKKCVKSKVVVSEENGMAFSEGEEECEGPEA